MANPLPYRSPYNQQQCRDTRGRRPDGGDRCAAVILWLLVRGMSFRYDSNLNCSVNNRYAVRIFLSACPGETVSELTARILLRNSVPKEICVCGSSAQSALPLYVYIGQVYRSVLRPVPRPSSSFSRTRSFGGPECAREFWLGYDRVPVHFPTVVVFGRRLVSAVPEITLGSTTRIPNSLGP